MADVASTLRLWSTTASSNSPAGTTTIGAGLDDNLRQMQAVVRQFLADQSSTVVPSAGVADLTTATGRWVPVSGSSTLTGFGTESAGIWYLVTLTGSPTINNGNISTPGAVTIVGAAGDMFVADSQGSGVWRVHSYTRASGAPVNMSPQSTALGATVALSNVANYFDGPSINVGTAGTWFVSGTVSVADAAAANFYAKLWDGTTLISAASSSFVSGQAVSISLSGFIKSPAGNLRISVRDSTATTGKIMPDVTGLGNLDSNITAIRIA